VPGYGSWWDVPVAETSTQETVRAAREQYERDASAQRQFV
jgi:3D-(3,5/4)-trihydroxycyclohexane-1,2-dione acylhydrolase (decyclizing)